MFREMDTTFCESHIDILNLLASIRGKNLVWTNDHLESNRKAMYT